MHVRNPEYFFAVVKERSISKAAKKLYISEPYLSQYITRLEKQAGILLIDRSVTPFMLTEAGRLLYEHLETLKNLDSELTASFSALQHQARRTLNVGMSSGRGAVLIPAVLDEILSDFPDISIVLHEHPSDELTMLLRENICELAIFHRQELAEDLVYEHLMDERIMLCAPSDHPLVRSLPPDFHGPLDLKLLDNENFILQRPNSTLAKIVQNIFSQYGITSRNQIVTSSSTTGMNLVAGGYGFIFMSESDIIRYTQSGKKISCFTFSDPPAQFSLVVAYKRSAVINPSARKFIELVKDYYRNHYKPQFT